MSVGLPSIIELVSGLMCLGLAVVLFSPMKRYYAAHKPVAGTSEKGGSEVFLLAWGVLVAAAIILVLYPFI
jgi:hypothetical protein